MAKSSFEESLEDMIIQEWSESWDHAVLDELWGNTPKTYSIKKSWRDRRGRQMHRISVSGRVLEWLETTQSQYGKSNPEWWKFQNEINITDKMLSMLILRWGKE